MILLSESQQAAHTDHTGTYLVVVAKRSNAPGIFITTPHPTYLLLFLSRLYFFHSSPHLTSPTCCYSCAGCIFFFFFCMAAEYSRATDLYLRRRYCPCWYKVWLGVCFVQPSPTPQRYSRTTAVCRSFAGRSSVCTYQATACEWPALRVYVRYVLILLIIIVIMCTRGRETRRKEFIPHIILCTRSASGISFAFTSTVLQLSVCVFFLSTPCGHIYLSLYCRMKNLRKHIATIHQ